MLVLASNVADGLIAAGALRPDFAFASGNYGLVAEVTDRYRVPSAVDAALFVLVLLWEGLAAWLFLRAFVRFDGTAGADAVYHAFGVASALWGAFILMDELFIAYHVAGLEGTHVSLLALQLVTLLVVQLLPSEAAGARQRRGDPPAVPGPLP